MLLEMKNSKKKKKKRENSKQGKGMAWREWQSTPVFLPEEFHGQRSMEGYSSWGCKELDMTEWLTPPPPHNLDERKQNDEKNENIIYKIYGIWQSISNGEVHNNKCLPESLRRNGVTIIVNKHCEMQYLDAISKTTEWYLFISKANHSISQYCKSMP